jgi:hypothetical protein
MSEILESLASPGWWFTTIVVAIFANFLANYIYDALKAKATGHWPLILMMSLLLIAIALFAASIFTLPISNTYAQIFLILDLRCACTLLCLGGCFDAVAAGK